jgi:nicotinate-nucleotide adenylyltransferase
MRQFHLDRVLFVPAFHPPHKSGITHAPYEDRVRMLELACRDEPRFEVSRLEQGTTRSYSIDTIDRVRSSLAPADELFFLIGADAFAEIQTWHRWRDVADKVRFLVVSRPGHDYTVPPGTRVERLDSLDLPVSSSEIRRALAAGESPSEVPPSVLEYTKQRGLYKK